MHIRTALAATVLTAIVTCLSANVASAGYITLNSFSTADFFGADNVAAESTTGTLDATAIPRLDGTGTARGTAQAHAEIDSTIRMSLHTTAESFFSVELRAAVREQYFLAGPTGESAALTVRLHYDGFTQQRGDTHANHTILEAHIGADHTDDGGVASLIGGLASGGDNTGFITEDNDVVHSGEVTHTFDATSGEEFQLAYYMRLYHFTGLGGMSQFTDLTNTTSVSFDVPEGFTLTSQGGFGAPTESTGPVNPVPEPSSLALFGLGALGLVGYGRPRRKTASPQQAA